MARLVGMLIFAGLFAALGCEQKPADRTPGKVTSEDVRRDADQAAKTAAEYSRQTSEWIEKEVVPEKTDRASGEVTPEDLRRDVGRAVKKAAELLRQTRNTNEPQKELAPQPADRTSGKVASEDVRRDAGRGVTPVSETFKLLKREYQNKLEAQLDEMDGKLTLLRERGRDLQNGAKDEWEQTMAELDTKRDAARARLAEVVRASEKAWNDVQYKADSAWDDLEQAFRDASKE